MQLSEDETFTPTIRFSFIYPFFLFCRYSFGSALMTLWTWAAVDKVEKCFCPFAPGGARLASPHVVPAAVVGLFRGFTRLLKRVPSTCFSASSSCSPATKLAVSHPLRQGRVFILCLFLWTCLIFFRLLTFGGSALKCSDWLVPVNSQWLHHVQDPRSGMCVSVGVLLWHLP